MSEYKKLYALFNPSEVYHIKFVCKLCGEIVLWRKPWCPNCKHTLEWPRIKNQGTFLEVHI